jgi:hypothetical protein
LTSLARASEYHSQGLRRDALLTTRCDALESNVVNELETLVVALCTRVARKSGVEVIIIALPSREGEGSMTYAIGYLPTINRDCVSDRAL